ncbi:hypothetical protein D3C80_2078940 [compost metagenome]
MDQFRHHVAHARAQLEAFAGEAERVVQAGDARARPHDRPAVLHVTLDPGPDANDAQVTECRHHARRILQR